MWAIPGLPLSCRVHAALPVGFTLLLWGFLLRLGEDVLGMPFFPYLEFMFYVFYSLPHILRGPFVWNIVLTVFVKALRRAYTVESTHSYSGSESNAEQP